MANVTYAPGIDYVQGSLAKPKKKEGHKCGDYLIGTHRTAATTNPDCTRLYYSLRSSIGSGEGSSQKPQFDGHRPRCVQCAERLADRQEDHDGLPVEGLR